MCINIPLDTGKGGQKSVGAYLTVIAKKVGWNYNTTMVWNKGNISNHQARGSMFSAKTPSVIAPVKLIVVFYTNIWSKQRKETSDITNEEFFQWTNGLWSFSGESKKRIGHPAPFSLELAKRCLKLFIFVDGVILDPFTGSGTTLLASKMFGRKSIGVDISENHCKLTVKRSFKFKVQHLFFDC